MHTETPRERLVRHVRIQAEACGVIGSPLYRDLLGPVADDVLAAGPAYDVLSGHELDPGPSALALRLMGSVHRLVLEGRAAGLAPPSTLRSAGGRTPRRPGRAGEVVLDVVERGGCDTEPLDPTTDEGRLRVTSYVWPDQLARLARLRGALELAALVPAQVQRMRAGDFVRRLELRPGTTTVLWHSVMWQYLDGNQQSAIGLRVAELGAQADAGARFTHLRLEPVRRAPRGEHEFLVVMRAWPGGDERILGTAHPHGLPTTWEQGA